MNILEEIRNDINGAAILKDWWGEGLHPVAQRTADHRSLSCIQGGENGTPCPLNRVPNWWDKAKGAIADAIRKQMALKSKMNMRLTFEEHCFMCKGCGCALPLKLWVPFEHIKAHTSAKQFEDFPSHCWMQKEFYAL